MPVRLRKIVGTLAILAFLAVYAVAAVTLYEFLPKNSFLELLYFAVAGIAWGVPLFPLLTWMNRP